MRLPLGVLIPTLNSRQYLVRSLPELRALLGLAEEAVVVDSFSEDGTLEFLRAALKDTPCRFFSHPRGLYQSWNFGLRQIRARYACIATAGDTISPAGLGRLVEVAERFGADVGISPPEVVTPEGTPVAGKRWPVHRLIQERRLTAPQRLDAVHVFLLSLLDTPDGIMGSAASNLYRTVTLQRLPFPTEFSHLGDNAWAVRYAFETVVALFPECVSCFMIHPSDALLPEDRKSVLIQQFFELGESVVRCALAGRSPGVPPELLAAVRRLGPEIRALRESQARYSGCRRESTAWFVSPQAWRARASRNAHRLQVARTKHQIRAQFGLEPGGAVAPQPAPVAALTA
jgi:hypothetical protein